MWHLLTHTAGLTYGFHYGHPVDAMYRANGFEWGAPPGLDLAACCEAWAGLPLLFEPGSEWNYSVATDVLGRVIEVISGQTLDAFFAERIFGPLSMTETGFGAKDPDAARRALHARPDPRRRAWAARRCAGLPLRRRRAGLDRRPTTTASRTCCSRTARRCSGRVRCASWRATTSRAAPSWRPFARPVAAFAETAFAGHGFGLGFSVGRGPGRGQDRRLAGRARVGRRGQHGVLGRSRRAHHGAVLHAAAAVQHLRAAPAAAPARLPGAGGLMRAKLVGVAGSHPVGERRADAPPQGHRVHAARPAEHHPPGDPAADALSRLHGAGDEPRRPPRSRAR